MDMMPYSVCCSQKCALISEESAPAVPDSTVSGKCMVIVQRNLTCRCSTGLSHSSCSSVMSMSEDSWSRDTHMLQCMVHVRSILAEMGRIASA